MRTLPMLLLALAAATPAAASDGITDAFAARSLLGPAVWARVARIDNARAKGTFARDAYPKTVYALVFELSGILWFYTDTDGTQSLSLRMGSAEADRADPGPLFLAIDRGFTRWAWVDGPRGPRTRLPGGLPNGCFVESVAVFMRRVAVGGRADAPRLLSYYVDTPSGRRGHTVLVYQSGGSLTAIDPDFSGRPVALPSRLGADPRSWSAYLRGGPVDAARVLPIARGMPAGPGPGWAMVPPIPAPAS